MMFLFDWLFFIFCKNFGYAFELQVPHFLFYYLFPSNVNVIKIVRLYESINKLIMQI